MTANQSYNRVRVWRFVMWAALSMLLLNFGMAMFWMGNGGGVDTSDVVRSLMYVALTWYSYFRIQHWAAETLRLRFVEFEQQQAELEALARMPVHGEA